MSETPARYRTARTLLDGAERDHPEARWQNTVIGEAKRWGWLIMHVYDSRKSAGAGFPDLVLCHPTRGAFAVIELKAARGYLGKRQRRWLAALTAAGIDARVWREEKDEAEMLETLSFGRAYLT